MPFCWLYNKQIILFCCHGIFQTPVLGKCSSSIQKKSRVDYHPGMSDMFRHLISSVYPCQWIAEYDFDVNNAKDRVEREGEKIIIRSTCSRGKFFISLYELCNTTSLKPFSLFSIPSKKLEVHIKILDNPSGIFRLRCMWNKRFPELKNLQVCAMEKKISSSFFALYLGASETSDQYNLKNGF